VTSHAGICALPSDAGPCKVPVVKWRYDREQGRCVEFTFGGCHGNANKFDSQQECSGVCPVTGASDAVVIVFTNVSSKIIQM